MAKLRAAILAAGRGVRIGADKPKGLLPVNGHKSLLHYQLQGLRRAGVQDLLVVTGFAPDAVQEVVTQEWGSDDVTFVFNARYASWGNFHSVRMAVDQSPGMDVLVVNSDIVVAPEVYERVIQTPSDLVLAVQVRRRLDDEDMRVQLHGNRVRAIGKDLKMSISHGEYAGISMIRPFAARLYQDIATNLEWLSLTQIYYEDVYARMLPQTDTRTAMIQEGEYAEVDVPDDFGRAAQVIERHWIGTDDVEPQPA